MTIWARSGDFEGTALANGIRLFYRKAPRFKTTWLALQARTPLARDPAPTALLPFVLRRGTRGLPTERAIRKRLETLCGTTLEIDVRRFGRWQVAGWQMEVPVERFLPERHRRDFLQEAFHLLRDLVADPLADGKAFKTSYVAREKENLRTLIRAEIEQKDRYVYERCRRLLAGSDPAGRHPYGSLEALRGVRPEGLYRAWKGWLAAAPMDLYGMGPLSREEFARRAAVSLTFPRVGGRAEPAGSAWRRSRLPRAVRRASERLEARQTRVCLGFTSRGDPASRRNAPEALAFAAAVLGGFPHSRLFQVVREKESLAYSVGCFADRATGWVFVDAGVEPARRERAMALIDREIRSVRAGRFLPGEFEKTRAGLAQGLRRLADARAAQIDAHYEEGILGRRFSLRRALAVLERLRPADVARAARGLSLGAAFTAGPA